MPGASLFYALQPRNLSGGVSPAFRNQQNKTMQTNNNTKSVSVCGYSEVLGTACIMPPLPVLIDAYCQQILKGTSSREAMFSYYLTSLGEEHLNILRTKLERFFRTAESCNFTSPELDELRTLHVEISLAALEARSIVKEREDWENEIEGAPRPFFTEPEWRAMHLENQPEAVLEACWFKE